MFHINDDKCINPAVISCKGTMHAIVQRTSENATKKQHSAITKAQIVSSRELQLIQSRDDILYPKRLFRAFRIDHP